jgi:putative sterol carrier protein
LFLDAGSFFLDLKNDAGSTGAGSPAEGVKVDVTMTLNRADFIKMFAGQMNPTSAFMTGRLKIKGDLGLAMKLEKLLKKLQPKL